MVLPTVQELATHVFNVKKLLHTPAIELEGLGTLHPLSIVNPKCNLQNWLSKVQIFCLHWRNRKEVL